jgi:hypothetical protein
MTSNGRVIDELERIRKKTILAYGKYYSSMSMEALGETTKKSQSV